MTVRTRFAPSPTGVLHLGSVRTALFSWLYARRNAGQFILRVEDTDRQRSTDQSIDAILDGMNWLGLDADEGPFYQMDRLDRYGEVVMNLLAADHAYKCYCTSEELAEMREAQISRGENPGYDGRCRDLEDSPERTDFVVRFRYPQNGQVVVNDLVRGDVSFQNNQFDDFVIVRSDGIPTYNFSVVVDDSDMDITHVIRGDDHLNNTPKQISLLQAMGMQIPQYAHVPMILGSDGARLSKRHGAVNILDYRTEGYLPEAMLNYLARLGWSHGDQEVFSIDEMIEYFDLSDINASASSFNPEKLQWLNQQHIINGSLDSLVPLLEEQMSLLGIDHGSGPDLHRVVEAFQQRSTTMRHMAESARYCFADFEEIDQASAQKNLRPVILEPLTDVRKRFEHIEDWQAANLAAAIEEVAATHGIKMGKIGQPIRVAVTGGSMSPPIDITLELVGKDRCLARLDKAINYVEMRSAAT